MKKKFFNAKIYRNDEATEMIVENGKITQIGKNLPKCDEEIDFIIRAQTAYTEYPILPIR